MFGEHRVRCHHCGKYFTCGDCIGWTCPECEQTGHSGFAHDCVVCQQMNAALSRESLMRQIEQLQQQVNSLQLEIGRVEAENRRLRAMRPQYRRAL